MRIVKVSVINGIPQYQDYGGIAAFGPTKVTDGECIGEYNGPSSEDELPTYTPPVVTEYRTLLTRREFFSSKTGLTGREQKKIRNYANDETKEHYGEVYELVSQIDVAGDVDLTLPDTIEGMAYLVALNLLDSDRHEEIMQGIPL